MSEQATQSAQPHPDGSLTFVIKMADGRPLRAADFAKHLIAVIRAVNATDKNMHGRVTTEWYLSGFDLQAEGVGYRITGQPKGADVRIVSVNENAPPIVNADRTPTDSDVQLTLSTAAVTP